MGSWQVRHPFRARRQRYELVDFKLFLLLRRRSARGQIPTDRLVKLNLQAVDVDRFTFQRSFRKGRLADGAIAQTMIGGFDALAHIECLSQTENSLAGLEISLWCHIPPGGRVDPLYNRQGTGQSAEKAQAATIDQLHIKASGSIEKNISGLLALGLLNSTGDLREYLLDAEQGGILIAGYGMPAGGRFTLIANRVSRIQP